MSVVVIGSANLDFSLRVPRLPRPGETVLGGDLRVSFGGKGANQAIAAHRAGARVHFIARIGTDPHGEQQVRHLLEAGLGGAGLIRDAAEPAGVALILVDQAGENLIALAPGSNLRLTPEDVAAQAAAFAGARVLLAQLEVPLEAVEVGLALARARGLTTILNPAPARPLADEVLRQVDVLTPNESEAALLSGRPVTDPASAATAGRALCARGCRRVVVTLGARGAVWCEGDAVASIAPFPVAAVDATAAGDAFAGALAAALGQGRPLDRALRFASAAGALAATRRGAQESLPSREEIEDLLAVRAD